MVPRITKIGKSFKGAFAYYLHDKGLDTSERVEFVKVINCPTSSPSRAMAHMVDTANNAQNLKRLAGIKPGRKLQKPVYAYSLSWHPTETPTKAEQVQAGKETLKLLGLSDHQAVIVAHNDTSHPHIHIIANRANPKTGLVAKMGNDRLKLSKWAEEYEQKQGKTLCPERVKNNAERPNRYIKHRSTGYKEHFARKALKIACMLPQIIKQGVSGEFSKVVSVGQSGAFEAVICDEAVQQPKRRRRRRRKRTQSRGMGL